MRADEFINEDEKLDEIIPLVTGAAALAGGVAKGVGGVAKGIGGVASGVGAATKGIGKGVGAAAKGVGNVVGAVGDRAAKTIRGKDDSPEIDQAKDNMLRPGNKIKLPTKTTGGPSEFKVTRVQGQDVEIENPDANTNKEEPQKIVYNKDDLKKSIQVQ